MSLFNIVKDHYYQLPSWMIQGMGTVYYCLPENLRYGTAFQSTQEILRKTQYLSKDKIDEMVNQLFVNTVQNAFAHVPFYQRLYREHGVDITRIKDIGDIEQLPTISKEDLRNLKNDFLADNWDKKQLMYITTSGSTGNPVGFYQPKSMLMIEWAYTMHIWNRIGCTVNSSRLVLRGKKLHSNKSDPDIFYDPLRRELSCNVFNMTELNLEKYCVAIEKYRPEFIHGYMSAVLMLSKYIASRPGGLRHQFKGVLATSETILPDQKAFVEKILHTRVFSFYGHSERLVIAGECEKSADYHVEPLYGYCELLDGQGKAVDDGEIVATGFLNPAMPLIRYRTGDLAQWSQDTACACGRSHMRLAGVHGRWNQDMLINSEGAYISLTALNIHSDEFDRITRYKLIQDTPGVVCMQIVPNAEFTNDDCNAIKQLLEKNTGHTIRFDLELVKEIPLRKNGKYQIVEQRIPVSLKENLIKV